MKSIDKLPFYYQNAEVTDEQIVEDNHLKESADKRNFVNLSFQQTAFYQPEIFYKPISKIWILND